MISKTIHTCMHCSEHILDPEMMDGELTYSICYSCDKMAHNVCCEKACWIIEDGDKYDDGDYCPKCATKLNLYVDSSDEDEDEDDDDSDDDDD